MTATMDYLITAEALATLDSARQVRIIDARFDLGDPRSGRRMYEAGHIPGAAFCDLDLDLAGAIDEHSGRHPLPKPEQIAATLSSIGADLLTPVVCYDAGSGALAARAWWILRWLGHANVRLLDGGLTAWQAAGFKLQNETPEFESRVFSPRPDANKVVSTDEIVAVVNGRQALTLVDARDAARYRGEVEPIDAVAGHIPGALNVPFSEALSKNGEWKSRDELARLWQEKLGPDRDLDWAVMCGSGVTACHLAISAMQAGYNEPRLYVGSWSEWIRDSRRPVALGNEL